MSDTPTSSANPSTGSSGRTRHDETDTPGQTGSGSGGAVMMPGMAQLISDDQLAIVPADEASWHDLQTIFGTTDYPSMCQCQRFKITGSQWGSVPLAERAERLREQTGCGNAGAPSTSGLVAYLDDEPVGWCAIEPRTFYPRLLRARVPWTGRQEDRTDDSVWAVTCFVTRKGFRLRGITYALARATIGFARDRGARAVEGYPMITRPGWRSPGANSTSAAVTCSPTQGSSR